MNIPQETENQTGRGGIEKKPKEKNRIAFSETRYILVLHCNFCVTFQSLFIGACKDLWCL